MQLEKFARVCNEVLQRIDRHQSDATTMALSAALLEQNPECYTVWTFRRRVLSDTRLVSFLLPLEICCSPAAIVHRAAGSLVLSLALSTSGSKICTHSLCYFEPDRGRMSKRAYMQASPKHQLPAVMQGSITRYCPHSSLGSYVSPQAHTGIGQWGTSSSQAGLAHCTG